MQNLRAIFRFAAPYLRRYRRRLALGVMLGMLFGASNAAVVWGAKALSERIAPPAAAAAAGPPPRAGLAAVAERTESALTAVLDDWLPRHGRPADLRQMAGGLLLLPLLMGLRGFIGYFSSYCLGWVSERVVNDLRLDVMRQFTRLSVDFFNRAKTGDLLTRMNGDVVALQRTLALGVSDLVKEPMTILSVGLLLVAINWQLTLFVLVFLPLCLVPMIVLGRKARRAAKAAVQAGVRQASLLVESLAGMRVVKAFNLEALQFARFQELSRQLVHHGMKGLQANELANPLIEVASALGIGFLLLYIHLKEVQFADMVVFLFGVVSFYTPVRKLARIHIQFAQTSVGVERLMQLLRLEPSVQDPPQPRPLPPFREAIRFTHVGFRYDDEPILTDFNVTIRRGEKLGLAGESGSGKSTLLNLLLRFYDPTAGRVTLDGVDVREFTAAELRGQMALVSQEIVLFDQTVAENIACGRPGATSAEVEAAARAAFAHDFIAALPQGYATPVGERGVTLSGGQRQRLAIARAFVRDAPILVLDEATAALDSQAEREVQAAIERLEEGRTVICVAHRLSTLANLDRILVLARGRIVEEGTFADLLRAGGVFAAMARMQGIAAA
ncbi:MAG: ABC transporter ATP-binding protein [Limisphaerales bacterium]